MERSELGGDGALDPGDDATDRARAPSDRLASRRTPGSGRVDVEAGPPANVALCLLTRSSRYQVGSRSMLRSSASARPAMTTRGWRS